MPYREGESLQERLDREKQLPVDEAVRIAHEVAAVGGFETSAHARRWDVDRDDSRFLMIQPKIGSAELILVQNWIRDVKARMER